MPPEMKSFEEVSGPGASKDSSPLQVSEHCESVTSETNNGFAHFPSDNTISDMLSNAHTEIPKGRNCSSVEGRFRKF